MALKLLLSLILFFFSRTFSEELLDGKIVGGHEVNIADFPYQLSLEFQNNPFCGATLISPNYAITASHCASLPAMYLKVRAGSSFRAQGGTLVQVKNITKHPKYNNDLIDYDIAIIEFLEPLNFTYAIQPVRLPDSDQKIKEGSVTVCSGWGAIQEGGNVPKGLRAVFVRVISKSRCRDAYGPQFITDRMICAGHKQGGKDACQGDSGGPLVRNGVLIGVVSWGNGCARPAFPGVYANVASLRDFIRNVTGL